MSDKPHRQYEVELHISADDHDELIRALHQLTFMFERGDIEDSTHTGVSGGWGWGHTLNMRVDREMTHDRYMDELNAYLDARKAARQQPGGEG